MANSKKHDYEPRGGENIATTCGRLVALAIEQQGPVTADFNGINLRAAPGMSAGDVRAAFDREMCRLRAEHEAKRRAFDATPEGQERLRKDAERRKYVAAEVAKGILPFATSDADGWTECIAKNQDPYGACAIRYAARWANYMERDLAKGAALASIVDDTSREADIEGVTGFMHGCAQSILEHVWVHGSALRGLRK